MTKKKPKPKTDDQSATRFEPMGTKVSPEAAVLWNAVCDTLGTDTYHLLQQFVYSVIRAASEHHAITPEIQQLIDLLDVDPGWQQAINLCAPGGRKTIAQLILIVEQEDHKGFGAVMVDKPFFGETTQTYNVDQIYERLTEVIYRRTYRRLRQLGASMGVRSVRQLLEVMIESQADINRQAEDAAEMQGCSEYTDTGRHYAYGKRTKRIHHRTPDSCTAQEQRIRFTADDRRLADQEAGVAGNDEPDFRPFGQEW